MFVLTAAIYKLSGRTVKLRKRIIVLQSVNYGRSYTIGHL